MNTVINFQSSNPFEVAAGRSHGVMDGRRLLAVIKGSSPVGDERFCMMAVLGNSSQAQRIEMALRAGLSWAKFAERFEALTGISRKRAHYATTLYPSLNEVVEPLLDERCIA